MTPFKWGLGAIFNYTFDFTLPPTVETQASHTTRTPGRKVNGQICNHSCSHTRANMLWISEETNCSWNRHITKLGQGWKRNLVELTSHLCFPADYISLDCTTHKRFMLERGFRTCLENTALSNAVLSFKSTHCFFCILSVLSTCTQANHIHTMCYLLYWKLF